MAKRRALRLRLAVVFSFVFLWTVPTLAAPTPAGRAVAVSGDVQTLPAGAAAWEKLANGREIFPGDAVRTGPDSRAAILCVDESQIKLNENTLMVFKSASPSSRLGFARTAAGAPDPSLYEVRQGEAWLRNSKEDFRFELSTPAVTAAIRGTEFVVRVAGDGFSTIALLQGRLAVFNDQGSLDLLGGEMASARPGQAPVKQVLLNPTDAVQWALYYPGTLSLRDLPLSALAGPGGPAPAMIAWDRGEAASAESLAKAALATDPADAGALTVLGFAALGRSQTREALPLFDKALALGGPGRAPAALVGRCLALYRQNAPGRALAAYLAALPELPPGPQTLALAGFFSLMAGKPEAARKFLDQGLAQAPDNVLCRSYLAQIDLVVNRKEEARSRAEATLAAAPDSPLANVTAGLTDIAFFDLPRAQTRMQKAHALAPDFVDALVYLARLQLGAEHLDDARETVRQALAIAPGDGLVMAMDGFVKLAFRDYDRAGRAFVRSTEIEPDLGEPHLGLGLCAYARGEAVDGLSQMLTATLLDPRVSLYQSVLGKAFYQARAFDKALDAYDYAASLDPNDPTPHLYKGIALTDLNRPGEAIEEINASIAKNDNRAVFRSKLMLDRDLAVRNFDLARAFAQLGLGEWSFSKALTAVKNDPLNSSAHLFMSAAFATTRQRVAAAGSELLLYRLLSPANQNTFTLYNDYTPMFESPYARLQSGVSAGAWSSGHPVWGAALEAYGGAPGVAAEGYASYSGDEGMRRENSQARVVTASGQLKVEPTVKDAFFASGTLYDNATGDNTSLNAWEYQNSTGMSQFFRNRWAELGYVRRFSPEATFIGYAKYQFQDWSFTDSSFDPASFYFDDVPVSENVFRHRDTSMEFINLQAQQQLVLGQHTLMAGLDVFSGNFNYDYRQRLLYWYLSEMVENAYERYQYSPASRSSSFYIMDYWKPVTSLVIELGLSADYVESPRYGYPDPVRRDLIGTRAGLNWQATKDDMVRLAFQRYLNAHSMFQATLQPSDVAGFPSWINADDGSQVTELGLAWERQWDEKTYTVARLNAHRIQNPQYDPLYDGQRIFEVDVTRYQAQLGINRILTPSLGLWANGALKRLLPDECTTRRYPNTNFFEANGSLGLAYLHASGLGASASGTLVSQHFFDRRALDLIGDPMRSEFFGLANAGVYYEFPGKRGRVSFDVRNIFDTHFSYQREMVALDAFYPARQFMFGLALYF